MDPSSRQQVCRFPIASFPMRRPPDTQAAQGLLGGWNSRSCRRFLVPTPSVEPSLPSQTGIHPISRIVAQGGSTTTLLSGRPNHADDSQAHANSSHRKAPHHGLATTAVVSSGDANRDPGGDSEPTTKMYVVRKTLPEPSAEAATR